MQAYMLDQWSESDWLKAEDEIFEKLALVDTGFLNGAPVQELATVGIFEYQNVLTAHHKLVYRRTDAVCHRRASAGPPNAFDAAVIKNLTGAEVIDILRILHSLKATNQTRVIA